MTPVVNHPHRLRRAFSLVEVVLALGMMSFAMISVVGLIPVGLGNFRDARRLSIEAGIAQRLSGDLRLAGRSVAAGSYYFDDQGAPVEEAAALYVARVEAPSGLEAGDFVGADVPARTILVTISRKGNPGELASFPLIVEGDR
jgi:uncharacterized protein (TIGR02598 family)